MGTTASAPLKWQNYIFDVNISAAEANLTRHAILLLPLCHEIAGDVGSSSSGSGGGGRSVGGGSGGCGGAAVAEGSLLEPWHGSLLLLGVLVVVVVIAVVGAGWCVVAGEVAPLTRRRWAGCREN